ncbi:MAG: hypothetical protein J7L66_05360, partial [Anaerolineaceae bacterium]|nr:hypothetical protein [Anaerolineaceae bacterium]
EVNPRFWGTFALSVKAKMGIAESVVNSLIFGSNISFNKKTPDGVFFEWLLQETYTAERMQGKKWTIIFDHIRKIFSSEENNFSYSIGINLLLALPHVLNNPIRTNNSNSIAKDLFE